MVLFEVGLLATLFVAYNVGGATTGPAFGPAIGASVISKVTAAALMSVSFFIGAWTVGRRVVETLGRDLLTDPTIFTLESSIGVLAFIGRALLLGNVVGAPSSTSMTAVGTIAGLGSQRGRWTGRSSEKSSLGGSSHRSLGFGYRPSSDAISIRESTVRSLSSTPGARYW